MERDRDAYIPYAHDICRYIDTCVRTNDTSCSRHAHLSVSEWSGCFAHKILGIRMLERAGNVYMFVHVCVCACKPYKCVRPGMHACLNR